MKGPFYYLLIASIVIFNSVKKKAERRIFLLSLDCFLEKAALVTQEKRVYAPFLLSLDCFPSRHIAGAARTLLRAFYYLLIASGTPPAPLSRRRDVYLSTIS